MAAVIKVRFPGADARTTDTERSLHSIESGLALLTELRERTLAVFCGALGRLFEKADDLLFEMGERSQDDAERRRAFDTMRVLRLERKRVIRCFVARFRDGFVEASPLRPAGGPVEASNPVDFTLQPSDALEEKVAIANMASKVVGLHQTALYDFECRLNSAISERGYSISPNCLNPGRICAAFACGIGAIETDLHVKLVVFKLLDQVITGEFGKAYQVALEVFHEHRILPAASARLQRSAGGDGTDQRLRIRRDPGEPSLAAATDQILRRHGLSSEADPNCSAKGEHLRKLIVGVAQCWGWEGLQAATQRLSMAGRLIDELLAEPAIPDEIRPILEERRASVCQIALGDTDFFANVDHPVRRDLCELLDAAIETRARGDSGALAKLVKHAGCLGSPPATGIEVGTDAPKQVSPVDVRSFLEQLRSQGQQRRERLLDRVRVQVAGELDRRIRVRSVPEAAQVLLRQGVAPLMALRLLRNGRQSVAFEQATATVDSVLTSLEFTPPASPEVLRCREDLLSSIVASLSDIGMRAGRVESLLEGMRELYAELDRAPAAPLSTNVPCLTTRSDDDALVPADAATLPAVTVMELLSRVLQVGTWYRVFDASHDQTRWLKLESFYPQHDSIIFSGFDESNRLSLHATRFACDLALGQSEPINPGDFARQSLAQLQAAKARGIF